MATQAVSVRGARLLVRGPDHLGRGDERATGVRGHIVWDSGFGDGWTEDELWGLPEAEARSLLYGTIEAEAARYAGRARAWVVANEVISHNRVDANGFWEFIPWYGTIGPTYVEEAFFHARQNDPNAILVINDFGFEVGSTATGRRTNILKAIDHLQSVGADVGALGVEAHLNYQGFARNFNPTAYRSFLSSVASRGLHIFVTELDVLDDGLRGGIATIDAGVADVYKRYLDVVLQEQAVKIVITFGLRTGTHGCRRTSRGAMANLGVRSHSTRTCSRSPHTTRSSRLSRGRRRGRRYDLDVTTLFR